MSRLTDAIKSGDTETALDLIEGRTIASRIYKLTFNIVYGNLLTTPELSVSMVHMRPELFGYTSYRARRLGYDPLQLAAMRGQSEVVQALLRHGVALQRPELRDYRQMDYFALEHHCATPLNLALKSGHDATAMILLEAGANVHAYSYCNLTDFGIPFHYLQCFFPSFGAGLNGGVLYAATPLYHAVSGRCSLQTMQALVARGARAQNSIKLAVAYSPLQSEVINQHSNHVGSILINAAALFGDANLDVIQFLLDNGAELNNYIFFAYNETQQSQPRKLADPNFNSFDHYKLYGNGRYDSAVTMALRGNKTAIASLLLQKGAQIIVQDEDVRGYVAHAMPWRQRALPEEVVSHAELLQEQIRLQQVPLENQNNPAPAQELEQAPAAAPGVFRRLVNYFVPDVQVPVALAPASTILRMFARESRPIIQIELDKLIALDTAMKDYPFDETLCCPITNELMREPVMLIESGNTYEKSALQTWLNTRSIDPSTNQAVTNTKTVANEAVKKIILAKIQELQGIAQAKREAQQAPQQPRVAIPATI